MLHYVMFETLRNTGVNSITSGKPGEDRTSSTLLRKACVEENGHHGTVASCAHGWALCVCVCVYWFCNCACVTCVRLLAVLWGMVLLGSPFRKPNTGIDCESWELWTSLRWLTTTGGLTSVALWGNSEHQLKLLSGGNQFQHTQDVWWLIGSLGWGNTLFQPGALKRAILCAVLSSCLHFLLLLCLFSTSEAL